MTRPDTDEKNPGAARAATEFDRGPGNRGDGGRPYGKSGKKSSRFRSKKRRQNRGDGSGGFGVRSDGWDSGDDGGKHHRNHGQGGKNEPKKVNSDHPVPEEVDLNEFQKQSLVDLYKIGSDLGLRVGGSRSKHQLVFDILDYYACRGTRIEAEGVIDLSKDGYGFLRWPAFNFAPTADCVYVGAPVLRQFSVRPGNRMRVLLRHPRERDKYLAAEEVVSVEGTPAGEWEQVKPFEKLTPLSPRERIILENQATGAAGPRVVDLIAPLGKGQRGLICAPPRGGKTILLKDIASSIRENHQEIELIILLLDERPEEVTDFRETVGASVFSSTFDEMPVRHVQVAELVLERAKRLVELGRDVVILLDSLTRLARGYNNLLGGKGGTLSGGLHKQALEKPRRFFGAARNVEEGGSLTILATALIETESRMDEVIFEEFKGTGNMEIQLDRELVEKRIFPAIHTLRTGTRKDDLLYHPDEFRRISMLRRQLSQLPAGEAMDVLIRNIRNTSSNAELLLAGIKV